MFLLVCSVNARGQAPQLPALPLTTVSLALPSQGTLACPTLTTGSNCIRNVPSGSATSLQKAISAATCGDTIVLVAPSTYTGNFTVPATSCSGWIEIVSGGLTSLPSPGSRVGPANVPHMATISTPNAAPAIQFLPGSNHWRLIGLEITTSYMDTVGTNNGLVTLGLLADGNTSISVQSQLPAYVIFDRIYIHGLSTSNTKRGLQMDGQSIGVVDSYCDEIHNNGQDSQCFASWNGVGPYLIQNDFVQAGAENILFGGADPAITNLVPSDITIIGNVIQKNLAWKTGTVPYNWVIKNLVEFKNAQRVLLDGNVIQNIWPSGQAGYVLVITPRNQSGKCPWCVVQDLTISHNLIQHAAGGLTIAGGDAPPPNGDGVGYSLPSARILIKNNVLDDISGSNWGGDGRAFLITSTATQSNAHDLTIDHNTAFPDHLILYFGDSGAVARTQFTNGLYNYGSYGVGGTGAGGGSLALNTYAPGYIWNDTVIISVSGSSDGNTWPSGTFWNSQTGIQFVKFASANYQLSATSPYHNAGSDGKDIGVWDWSCLNSDSAAALAGTFVPGPSGCASAATTGSENLLPQPPASLSSVVQ